MSNRSRPEKIEGYEHPSENTSYSKKGVYKTFTEGLIKQDVSGNTTVGKQYATNGEWEGEKCPECGEQPVRSCPCGYSDKECAKGHRWYTDRDGKPKRGTPH